MNNKLDSPKQNSFTEMLELKTEKKYIINLIVWGNIQANCECTSVE